MEKANAGTSSYDAQALNRFTYVVNNPVNFTDPTGHVWTTCFTFTGRSGEQCFFYASPRDLIIIGAVLGAIGLTFSVLMAFFPPAIAAAVITLVIGLTGIYLNTMGSLGYSLNVICYKANGYYWRRRASGFSSYKVWYSYPSYCTRAYFY